MALKKSELYSSLWSSCDELRGGMEGRRHLWPRPHEHDPAPDENWGPSLYCAVIVKRVDERTRSKTSINELLRD